MKNHTWLNLQLFAGEGDGGRGGNTADAAGDLHGITLPVVIFAGSYINKYKWLTEKLYQREKGLSSKGKMDKKIILLRFCPKNGPDC